MTHFSPAQVVRAMLLATTVGGVVAMTDLALGFSGLWFVALGVAAAGAGMSGRLRGGATGFDARAVPLLLLAVAWCARELLRSEDTRLRVISSFDSDGWSTVRVTLTVVAGACALAAAIVAARRVPITRWTAKRAFHSQLDAVVSYVCVILFLSVLMTETGVSLGDASPSLLLVALVWQAVGIWMFTRHQQSAGPARFVLLLTALACLAWVVCNLALFMSLVDEHLPWSSMAVGASAFAITLVLRAASVAMRPGAPRGGAAVDRAHDHPHDGAAGSYSEEKVVPVLPDVMVLLTVVAVCALGLSRWHNWALASVALAIVSLRQVLQAIDARRVRSSLEGMVAAQTVDLVRANQTQRHILDAVAEGIVGIDSNGRVTFVNAQARRMLDWPGLDLLERSFCDSVCGVSHDTCPLDLVLTTGEELRDCTSTYLTRAGSSFPVEVNASPVADANAPDRFGAVIAFRDMTSSHAVEQHKQQFVSSVSHELRTPLTSIRGVLEMLADGDAGELPHRAVELVGNAERGVVRLGRLVDDIIDLEQLAAGRFRVTPTPTLLDGLVTEAASSLQALAEQSDVRVDTSGTRPVVVLCDADRVVQAVVNLLGNSIKFSPPGTVVHVRSLVDEHEVRVEVEDHGRGIPGPELPHVFDRFRQVTVTDATDKGGTGLGLTITRSIVERHGGRIWVDSVEDIGTTFTFTLPRPTPTLRADLPPDEQLTATP